MPNLRIGTEGRTQVNQFFLSFVVSSPIIDSIPQGNIWQQILSFHFILELVTTIPFVFTVSATTSNNRKSSSESVNWQRKLILTFFFLFLFCRRVPRPLADTMAPNAKLIHPDIFELLACQALAGEYVRKCRFQHVFASLCVLRTSGRPVHSYVKPISIFRTISTGRCRNHNRHYHNNWRYYRRRYYV